MTTEEIEFRHADMVSKLVKPGHAIKEQMTPSQAHLLHMAVGVCGEAGELIDAIKKEAIYQKILDGDNVLEELGDIEFYLEGIRQQLRFSREQCLQANYEKLSKRYEGLKYSNQAAIDRKDKTC